jgi:hypothetical protein
METKHHSILSLIEFVKDLDEDSLNGILDLNFEII